MVGLLLLIFFIQLIELSSQDRFLASKSRGHAFAYWNTEQGFRIR